MSTFTDIGNNALMNIGAQGSIADWSTDTGIEAQEVRRNISKVVNEILEENDWKFARRTVTLSVHDDVAPSGWNYRYVMPSDCLVPLAITIPTRARNADPLEFDCMLDDEGYRETIVTDASDAELIYTSNKNIEDTKRWPHNFERCVEHKLSYMLGIHLKKADSVVQSQYGLYQASLRKATYVNNKGKKLSVQQKPRSVRARG
jgi:hypothetical protein